MELITGSHEQSIFVLITSCFKESSKMKSFLSLTTGPSSQLVPPPPPRPVNGRFSFSSVYLCPFLVLHAVLLDKVGVNEKNKKRSWNLETKIQQ